MIDPLFDAGRIDARQYDPPHAEDKAPIGARFSAQVPHKIMG